jgi:hypothetical protein
MPIDIHADLYKSYFESVEKYPVLMWQFEDVIYFEYESHLYIISALPRHSSNCSCQTKESSEVQEMR